MRFAALLIVSLLSACTLNILAGNCTRVIAEMGEAKQTQEQCR